MNKPFSSLLYLVVSEDACLGRNIVWVTEEAVKGGADLVQIREKCKSGEAFKTITLQLKEKLSKYSVPLLVNDNLEVAMACQADGIHVGNTDISPPEIKKRWQQCGLIGYSVEYLEQMAYPEIQDTDYLGISPVFRTSTKTDTVTEWGLEGLSKIRQLTNKPLVAIGRMNENNAFDTIRAGADCIAVVSAICGADNPAKIAEKIRNQIEKAL